MKKKKLILGEKVELHVIFFENKFLFMKNKFSQTYIIINNLPWPSKNKKLLACVYINPILFQKCDFFKSVLKFYEEDDRKIW